MARIFTIGQLAKEVGVNLQTIRFYERRRLLLPETRRASGYRVYTEESLKRLHFILQAKKLGFTLKEIQSLLGLRVRSVESCKKVRAQAAEKLKTIQEKILQLTQLEKILKALMVDCDQRVISDQCPILERMEYV